MNDPKTLVILLLLVVEAADGGASTDAVKTSAGPCECNLAVSPFNR